MKQTSVEWLEEELKANLKKVILEGNSKLMESLFEQAKEKEKERLEDAYNTGIWDVGCRAPNFDEYYKRTFKSE